MNRIAYTRIQPIKFIRYRPLSSIEKPIRPKSKQVKQPEKTDFISNISSQFTSIMTGFASLGTATLKVLHMWQNSSAPISSRAETRLVLRVRRDWIRMPFAIVYVCLPFTLPTLPIVFRFFPGFIPEHFLSPMLQKWKQDALYKSRKKASIKVYNHFLDMISNMKVDESLKRDRFVAEYTKKDVSTMAWIDIIPILNRLKFRDLKGVSPFVGSRLDAKWYAWADWIVKDTALLQSTATGTLTSYDLVEALNERGVVMTLEEIEKSGRERLRAEIEFVRKISERCTDVEVLGMILVLRQAMISMANNPTESK